MKHNNRVCMKLKEYQLIGEFDQLNVVVNCRCTVDTNSGGQK